MRVRQRFHNEMPVQHHIANVSQITVKKKKIKIKQTNKQKQPRTKETKSQEVLEERTAEKSILNHRRQMTNSTLFHSQKEPPALNSSECHRFD